MEKKHGDATEHHIEATASAVDNDHKDGLINRHIKQMNVQSVALADAIAKDKPDYKSRSQFALYAMMALCVLSECRVAPQPGDHLSYQEAPD